MNLSDARQGRSCMSGRQPGRGGGEAAMPKHSKHMPGHAMPPKHDKDMDKAGSKGGKKK